MSHPTKRIRLDQKAIPASSEEELSLITLRQQNQKLTNNYNHRIRIEADLRKRLEQLEATLRLCEEQKPEHQLTIVNGELRHRVKDLEFELNKVRLNECRISDDLDQLNRELSELRRKVHPQALAKQDSITINQHTPTTSSINIHQTSTTSDPSQQPNNSAAKIQACVCHTASPSASKTPPSSLPRNNNNLSHHQYHKDHSLVLDQSEAVRDLELKLADQSELSRTRLKELESLTKQYKEALENIDKLKSKPKCIPKNVITESAEYKTLQNHFNVLYNEATQLKSQLVESRQLIIEMKNAHAKQINQIEHDELKIQKELREQVDIISKLPYEIARYVMSFLSPEDIARAAQTCRSWRTICEDTSLWREKCKEEGLLDCQHTLSGFFKKRLIEKRQQVGWKEAYVQYLKVLRSWQTRKFVVPNPLSTSSSSANSSIVSTKSEGNFIQIRCHDDSVITCLQYNPLTDTIVSGSDDFTLKVWSAETGQCITTLEGHTGGVWSSQLSPSDIVISGSTDRTLKVWKAHAGQLLHTLNGHTSTVRCLALNKDRVVSGSRDATLRLWDINEGVCLNVFIGHSAAVRCVEFKDNIIVSGAYDCVVMVWDAVTGACLHELECHSSRIYSLQFDGKTIASGSLDATICIWDVKTGKLRHQLTGHTSLTSKMQLKGDLLVSANADSYCKIWNIKTGACLRTLGGENKHSSAITSVYFNKRHVVTSSDDGTVKLWDMKTGNFIRNIVVLPKSSKSGVVWRIRASYTKLICAIGYRGSDTTEDTHLLVYKFAIH